jgi:hypothetical protein
MLTVMKASHPFLITCPGFGAYTDLVGMVATEFAGGETVEVVEKG